jgi:hypothetical protein
MPRGLRIRYAGNARALHDHPMDLDSFAVREFHAGEMAVVFYRKHPGQDEQLQVRWLDELIRPVETLQKQPDFLLHLEAFDRQTDTLLRALAASLEELLAMDPPSGSSAPAALPADRLRAVLHSVLRVIFDVERTRGKVQEWFSMVDDPARTRAARSLAGVLRKTEFLNLNDGHTGLRGAFAPLDGQVLASLRARIDELEGATSSWGGQRLGGRPMKRAVRRLVAKANLLPRLLTADRFLQARLQASAHRSWLEYYQRVRGRIRSLLL